MTWCASAIGFVPDHVGEAHGARDEFERLGHRNFIDADDGSDVCEADNVAGKRAMAQQLEEVSKTFGFSLFSAGHLGHVGRD